MRLVRALSLMALGFWGGTLAAASLVKRAVPSRGDSESDEVSLVAILDGLELTSRATGFRGGSMLAWFGGISVDLREAELASDGAHLDLHAVNGGIAVKVPPGWRVRSSLKALVGGVDARVPEPDDPEAPVLSVGGLAVFGGIAVSARAAGD